MKPTEDADPAPNLSPDITAWIDRHLDEEHIAIAREADRVIAATRADEAAIATWIDSRDEDTDKIISLLEAVEAHYNKDQDEPGIDPRFDRVIDRVFDLPDHPRAQAIALWEGFLAGIAAAA